MSCDAVTESKPKRRSGRLAVALLIAIVGVLFIVQWYVNDLAKGVPNGGLEATSHLRWLFYAIAIIAILASTAALCYGMRIVLAKEYRGSTVLEGIVVITGRRALLQGVLLMLLGIWGLVIAAACIGSGVIIEGLK